MEITEFNREMSRMKACYPQSFNDVKIKIIFEKVSHISGEEFHRICEKLIGSMKHAPNVSDFIDLVKSSTQYTYGNLRLVKAQSCDLCDSGIVNAVRRNAMEQPYVFKCNCDVGRNLQENYPSWFHDREKDFEVMNEEYYRKQISNKKEI